MDEQSVSAKCAQLDEDNCLCLASILEAFKRPISEEQAWALCYRTLKCIRSIGQPAKLYLISDAKYVFIDKDGTVHEKTLTFTDGMRKSVSCVRLVSEPLRRCCCLTKYSQSVYSLNQILSSLGVTLFHALDYGVAEEEERVLESNLETMIERLVASDQLTDISETQTDSDSELDLKDEGIERDSLEDECEEHINIIKMATEEIMEMCASHVKYPEEANGHYKMICKALVSETIELSKCYDKIHKGTKELRKSSIFIENENKEQRQVEKDVHAMTLELIKSRPKLSSASRRKLTPAPPKELTPYEKLMKSIRQHHKLRPIPRHSSRTSHITMGKIVNGNQAKTVERNDTPCPQRRLIKPDFTFSFSISSEDEEDQSIVEISLSDKCIEAAIERQCRSQAKETVKSSPETNIMRKPLGRRLSDFFRSFRRSAQLSQQ